MGDSSIIKQNLIRIKLMQQDMRVDGSDAVSLGTDCGKILQGSSSVAIGKKAGETSQGQESIAIGDNAGNTLQGANSIAIGADAGKTSLPANSIVLNASGSELSPVTAGTFVKPINAKDDTATTGSNIITYNTTNSEIGTGIPIIPSYTSTNRLNLTGQDGMVVNAFGSVYLYYNDTWINLNQVIDKTFPQNNGENLLYSTTYNNLDLYCSLTLYNNTGAQITFSLDGDYTQNQVFYATNRVENLNVYSVYYSSENNIIRNSLTGLQFEPDSYTIIKGDAINNGDTGVLIVRFNDVHAGIRNLYDNYTDFTERWSLSAVYDLDNVITTSVYYTAVP